MQLLPFLENFSVGKIKTIISIVSTTLSGKLFQNTNRIEK